MSWELGQFSDEKIKTVLSKIKKVIKQLGQGWFATGTALGIVRAGKVMPWDVDIDFEVWDTADPNKIMELMREEGFKHLSIHDYKGRIEQIGWEYEGIHTDVTFKHLKGKEAWCTSKDLNKWVNKAYPKELFEVNELRDAYGLKDLPLPYPVEEYLKINYGDDWMIPQPDFWSKHGYYSHRSCIRNDWNMET